MNYLIDSDENLRKGLSVHENEGKHVINAPVGAKYLSEFMSNLPMGILNKMETGCGATSVILENNQNAIICSPTRQLIISKTFQYPNEKCPYRVLGIMKGVDNQDIEDYITACRGVQPVKIMVTYDSYPRIANILDEDLDSYHIVVDEYQELLDACVYRNAAIKNLLRELKGKKNTTFMSATPIPYTYVPEELEDLENYEIHWPDAVKVIPHRLGTDKPLGAIVNMIQNHKLGRPFELGGEKVEEYFFFVNTVKGIRRIISKAKLRPEDVKVVCGKSELNRLKLGNIEIKDVTAPNKTFNFCTKTVFYGADFYSNSGLIVIVSDGYIKSTLLDISTDIQQIAGRIRNLDNPFRNIILHIYSSENTQLLSESEFAYWIEQRLDYAQTSVDAYQSLPKDQKRAITGRIRVDDPDELAYYDQPNDTVVIDKLKEAHHRHRFETVDAIYKTGISIREDYQRNGYNLKDAFELEKKIKTNVFIGSSGGRFKELYLLYIGERKKMCIGKTEFAEELEKNEPLVWQAYQYLDEQIVEDLLYNEEKIRDHVHLRLPETQEALRFELRLKFKINTSYSNSEIKSILEQCYKKLKIHFTAKATDLNCYFKTRKAKISIDKGKRIDGLRIVESYI